jgi:hypothetical protein
VPPGEHEATINLAPPPTGERPENPFDVDTLPTHDLGPWPEGLSLRREDIYDEDGRRASSTLTSSSTRRPAARRSATGPGPLSRLAAGEPFVVSR